MIAELRAIRDRLDGVLPGRVGIGDMSGTMPPFASVWAPPGNRDEASPGARGDYAARVGVTFTADNTERVLELATAGIEALTPERATAVIPATRHVQLTFFEARAVQVDRSVTLTETDSHPAYVVALFDLTSQEMP